MTKFINICLISVLLISCYSREQDLAEGILTEAEIIPILMDIHIAEATILQKNLKGDSAQQYASDYYAHIYKTHNVTEKTFQKSFDYYSNNMDVMDKIYEQLIEELSKKEGEYYQKKTQKDTINIKNRNKNPFFPPLNNKPKNK
ncbi:DUF4296 domain-containing protein [Candidatus Amoebophilus asiaticus]|nr:DUF4296 domain-containing protein [Candidatus Amoebophilus asiaticus]